ncbi:hypothetical protein KIF59_09040 [Enterobacter cloacae subsp. cloacae]|nr:hypothetical protein [Enterobacter cloacae subsp. cloacae]
MRPGLKAGSATQLFFGVQPALVDNEGNPLDGATEGNLRDRRFPRPGQARTPFGDHERFEQTYFNLLKTCTSAVTARRDEDGYYWITGRVDDAERLRPLSGHRGD